MVFDIIQLLVIVAAPYMLTKLTLRLGTEKWLSPVVLCYMLGIIVRNFTAMPLEPEISNLTSQATILLAIPLLLYSTDLLGWFRLAKTTLLSFFLVVVSVMVACVITGFLFRHQLTNSWLLSGMLSGVFIGGTPNLNAVGIALGAGEDTLVTLNAAEIACGGTYLIFLTSVAHRFYGLILPDFPGERDMDDDFLEKSHFVWRDVALGILLTVLLAGASVGLTVLFTGELERPGLIIFIISLLSVLASFSSRIRGLKGVFESGEYLLLMFCVAIGMLADFGEIWTSGGYYILFTAVVMLMTIVFHVLLCKLCRIDRDTMIITQTAGFYGPPFIGQVAAVIKNRSLIFSGIATGLVGLAVANFIGLLIGQMLDRWLY